MAWENKKIEAKLFEISNLSNVRNKTTKYINTKELTILGTVVNYKVFKMTNINPNDKKWMMIN